MNVVEVKKDIYSVGAVDWNVRSFHGYSTNSGATYNAYLIMDEKITLIDTVKAPFAKELLDRIREIVEPEKIDYIISNHVEMDHSGALPQVVKAAPNATVITSDPNGMKGLSAHYGKEIKYQTVKAGDTLEIGKRTLTFVATPMLHWPDNMVTYCPEDKILFSNDAFGQHYASNMRFDTQVNLDDVYREAKKYYANILMPYGAQARKALEIVKGLDMEVIAPSHGVIWTEHIGDILEKYEEFAGGGTKKKACIVYDSMWHSTEKMAFAVVEGFSKAGVGAHLYDLKDNHISDIMTDLLDAEYIAVGSPTLNSQMMPTVAGFLCYMKGLAPKKRKAIAFGSYGWGGQSIKQVYEALEGMGCQMLLDPIRQMYIPTDEDLKQVEETITSIIE
ncbi:FprA family A-type flavoprotein [Lactonifactor longoviformis]|uniref:Flavorubredoxin n=1 Tax=Lactonifactor longoviformis DSM 17459 TaxID=1122155 RepID=A0A1M4SGF3_9CLOT|nr:FprA family A-type flavoprotein [Lactonifactor longoviformis]MCB5711995.1 FprA family A-type flavoprotein [Lactonifactor longoviformis]MCB5716039.1 FprA family A-type flavoprotein [Lactonifactor longoviformis]MCQ4670894.1 FprA family A-type flavoprotein [Lactonifactor longoviformis]POP34898.1 FprA family A-type flavoprotein [Lactonifactor longoviformis]SHE31276.1 Flavorubredoxin [Lactonifactor longoviformis DSM 17459]